jgi:hypothetical protein
MTYSEIVQKLLEGDQEVTECVFFYKGKTCEEIRDLRRKDPKAAARLKMPVCATFYRLFVNILYKLLEPNVFKYESWASALYYYLIVEGHLSKLNDPQALEDWLKKTATGFFTRLILEGIDPEDYYKLETEREQLVPGGKGKVKVVKQDHDFYKKRKTRVVRIDDNPQFDEGSIDHKHAGDPLRTDTLAEVNAEKALIDEAISKIQNKGYREIIRLERENPDTPHKYLAEHLGISETNYGVRLQRAKEKFAQIYMTLISTEIS